MRAALAFLCAALLAPCVCGEEVAFVYRRHIDRKEVGKNEDESFTWLVTKALGDEYLNRAGLRIETRELQRMAEKFGYSWDEMQKEPNRIREAWVRSYVWNFKLQKALWEKHGGRVVLSAFGLHSAPDALIAELEALEKSGEFAVYDARLRELLFRRLKEQRGDGVVTGERARQVITRPPWE